MMETTENIEADELPPVRQINQTKQFQKAYKKLHANQKNDINHAIKAIELDPSIGDKKKGDLDFVWVYKFKMVNQPTLLAYTYEDDILTLTLIAFGSHENFYRDIKLIV